TAKVKSLADFRVNLAGCSGASRPPHRGFWGPPEGKARGPQSTQNSAKLYIRPFPTRNHRCLRFAASPDPRSDGRFRWSKRPENHQPEFLIPVSPRGGPNAPKNRGFGAALSGPRKWAF